jgi:hypothetical protein
MAGRGAADSRHRAKRDQLPEVLATLPDDGEVQAQVDSRRPRPAASPVTVCRRTRALDAGQGVRAVATHPRHVQNGQTDQTLAHEAP